MIEEKEGVQLPLLPSYIFSVLLNTVSKVVVLVFAVIIAAYRAELYSAATTVIISGNRNDRDLPLGICFFLDDDDDVYGDRICNNALAASIISILICLTLMVIDLQIPCLIAKYKRLAHLLNLIWAVVLIIYWLITAALLGDLHSRYCDEDETGNDCGEIEDGFVILPIFAFVCMGAWIAQALISLIRLIIGK